MRFRVLRVSCFQGPGFSGFAAFGVPGFRYSPGNDFCVPCSVLQVFTITRFRDFERSPCRGKDPTPRTQRCASERSSTDRSRAFGCSGFPEFAISAGATRWAVGADAVFPPHLRGQFSGFPDCAVSGLRGSRIPGFRASAISGDDVLTVPEEPAPRPCEAHHVTPREPAPNRPGLGWHLILKGRAFRFAGLQGFMLPGFRDMTFSFAGEPASRPRETYRKRSAAGCTLGLASAGV